MLARDTRLNTTHYDMYHRIKQHDPLLQKYLAQESKEVQQEARDHAHIVLYDSNLNWFSRVWLFERRRFYGNFGFLSVSEKHLLKDISIKSFYFIKATTAAPLDSVQYLTETPNELETYIVGQGIVPDLIYRDDGEVAFKVYHVEEVAGTFSL